MASFQFGTPAATPSAASASSLVLRAAPGAVDFISITTGTTAGYLMLHNLTAAPSNGAVTPVLPSWQVPANTTVMVGFDPPLQMTTGAVLTFSSTGPTTQTLSATAMLGGRIT